MTAKETADAIPVALLVPTGPEAAANLLDQAVRAGFHDPRTKQAPGPGGRSRGLGVGFEKLSRELRRHSVLGPATCREPGKRPGPPPATVKIQAVDTRVGPSQGMRLPDAIRPKAENPHGEGTGQARSGKLGPGRS